MIFAVCHRHCELSRFFAEIREFFQKRKRNRWPYKGFGVVSFRVPDAAEHEHARAGEVQREAGAHALLDLDVIPDDPRRPVHKAEPEARQRRHL